MNSPYKELQLKIPYQCYGRLARVTPWLNIYKNKNKIGIIIHGQILASLFLYFSQPGNERRGNGKKSNAAAAAIILKGRL